MKVIITESKLDEVIYNYIDELFAAENGSTEIHTLESINHEEGGTIENVYDIVNDDYYDDDNDGEYLFTWSGKKYYENHAHQSFGRRLVDDAPIVEINDGGKVRNLDSYFGNLWRPVFIKWFKDKVNLPIKTLYPQS
jgi:hypothetical protein